VTLQAGSLVMTWSLMAVSRYKSFLGFFFAELI